MKLTIEERIAVKVKPPNDNGCVEWSGSKDGYGYGKIRHKNRCSCVHRIVWELRNGPIPSGMLVLHRCDNPSCSNIDHLFLGTHDDNMKDMVRKGRSAHLNGIDNPRSKLTEDQVAEIRNSWPDKSMRCLARKYCVYYNVIYQIIHRETWKHVA